MLSIHFHRDAVPEVVRLQLGEPDEAAVHLAEPPDIFAGHRTRDRSAMTQPPARPEDRRVRCHWAMFRGDTLLDELDGAANVLGDRNADLDADEKAVLVGYCRATGSTAEYLRGRGGCGLLVSFKHGCPNNSLPILWGEAQGWRALFRRHAI